MGDPVEWALHCCTVLGVLPVIVGIGVATISAALAIKWLVSYLSRHGLALFGWYRILLSIVLGIMVARGMLTITPEKAPSVGMTEPTAE